MLSMFLWKATKDREKWRQGKNTISRVTGRSNAIFYMNKNNTWTRDTCFHRMKRFVSIKLLLAGFKRTLFWQNHWHFQRTEGFNCSRCGNKVISNSFSITPVEAFEPNKYHEINKKSNILYQELHDVDYFQRRKPVYLQNLLLCNVSEAHIAWMKPYSKISLSKRTWWAKLRNIRFVLWCFSGTKVFRRDFAWLCVVLKFYKPTETKGFPLGMLIEFEWELFTFCRNGTELPYIAQDRSYDFNFQEARHLPQERIVREGDSMQIVCNYNSKDRTNITLVSFSNTCSILVPAQVTWGKSNDV